MELTDVKNIFTDFTDLQLTTHLAHTLLKVPRYLSFTKSVINVVYLVSKVKALNAEKCPCACYTIIYTV